MGISLWARGSFSIQDSACAISTEHHENQNWPSPHPSAGLDLSENCPGQWGEIGGLSWPPNFFFWSGQPSDLVSLGLCPRKCPLLIITIIPFYQRFLRHTSIAHSKLNSYSFHVPSVSYIN